MTAKPSRRILSYLFAVLILVMMYYYLAGRFAPTDLYTYKEFVESLEQGNVESVTIRPNAQGVIGQVIVRMKDNEVHRMYVTDVREAEKDAGKY